MVLIYLQKSFDTVDYTILTTKLNAIGIDDSAGSWFKSYLTGRKQVVKINGRLSTAGKITCGVPHGSILGPLLFNIYVNGHDYKCELGSVPVCRRFDPSG